MRRAVLAFVSLALVSSTACAADKKISQLTNGGTCAATDNIPIERSGANLRCQVGTMAGQSTSSYAAVANNLSDLTNASQARINLGLAIGTDVQAYDADLTTWGAKTAPSGTVVGTSDTQTLTNKTIDLVNAGLSVRDTNASHSLYLTPGSDLTANRTLTLTTGDAARTVTINGNPTLNDWFDQSVKVAATPTFGTITTSGNLVLTGGGTIQAPSGGIMRITNGAGTDFTRLQFGGGTSSFPAIKKNSTSLDFVLADDSAPAPISSAGITSTGNSYLNGGLRHATRVVTAAGAVTVTAADYFVIVNKSSGAATTVNLPACASGQSGTVFHIKDGKGDAGTNNITLDPNSSETIDGATTFVMNANYQSQSVVCNGTQWNIF